MRKSHLVLIFTIRPVYICTSSCDSVTGLILDLLFDKTCDHRLWRLIRKEMAIKLRFTRQAGLRAYGYIYTMLGTKDSNSQANDRDEGDGLERPGSSQKYGFWTRQR